MHWDIEEQPIFFPPHVKKIYKKVYKSNRFNYCTWLGKISSRYKNDINWWMTAPTLRNPYTSNLLNYLNVLDTLSKIRAKKIEIITSSIQMKILLNKYFKNKFNLLVHVKKKDRNFLNIKIFLFFKSVIFQLFIFFYVKIFIKKKFLNNKSKYVLIDTFLTLNKEVNSKFYPSIGKKKNIFFVPTIVHTLNFFRLVRILNNTNKENYLFKEHYLSFKDLFFSFFHFQKRKKFLKNDYKYKGFNLSKIVNEEISSYDNYNSIVVGILNYKFFYNISLKKIHVKKTVNWFENQVIDRGWNMGFRKFYKAQQNCSFGYQNFTRHYNLISFSPSISESDSKVTPHKIIVISKHFRTIAKEFNKKQLSLVGPTSRFKNMVTFKKSDVVKKKIILLILSGIYKIDKALIKITTNACVLNNKIKIYVKQHPIMPLKTIVNLSSLPENLIVTNTKLDELLKNSLISITSGPTSAIQESYNMNNFLILPNIEIGTQINAERLKLNKNKFFVIETGADLLTKIAYIKKNKFKIKKNSQVKFFEEINKKNIDIFY